MCQLQLAVVSADSVKSLAYK